MANYIIDPVNDAAYYTDVRDLLGITDDDMDDAALKSDIVLGAAERSVCKIFVPNWQSVMTGSDPIAADSLRSAVIIKVAMNILNMPANQNLLQDQFRLIDMIITAKKQTLDQIKEALAGLFEEQLSLVGVVHTGDWPTRTLVGKSDSISVYDFYVDTEGAIQDETA